MQNLVVGAALDFSGVTLPFNTGDLVASGTALLGIVGSFVLLGLAFKFVPSLITLLFQAFRAAKGK